MPSSSRSHPTSRACGAISAKRALDETRDGHGPTAREVDDGRLQSVARRTPLVLVRQDRVEDGQDFAGPVGGDVARDQRLHVGGQRDGVLHAAHGVHHPHLDRAEAGMRPHVPPDPRVVLEAAARVELRDDRGELLVVAEMRRRTRARERREDQVPAGGQTGRLAAPERRAGRQRDQLAQVRLQRADDPDRPVGIIDGDMDVQAEDQLPARRVLKFVDERAVPLATGHPLALEQAERMRAGRAEPQALRVGDREGVLRAGGAARARRRRRSRTPACGARPATRTARPTSARRSRRAARTGGMPRSAERGRTTPRRAA